VLQIWLAPDEELRSLTSEFFFCCFQDDIMKSTNMNLLERMKVKKIVVKRRKTTNIQQM
jgi:hypothetical protein